MNRLTHPVRADRCDYCGADVLTSNWDDYEQQTDEIIADPTALTRDLQIACVILDRPIYTLDRTAVRTYRLARRHAWNSSSELKSWTVAIVPAHRCGATLAGRLDDDTWADLHPTAPARVEEPTW